MALSSRDPLCQVRRPWLCGILVRGAGVVGACRMVSGGDKGTYAVPVPSAVRGKYLRKVTVACENDFPFVGF